MLHRTGPSNGSLVSLFVVTCVGNRRCEREPVTVIKENFARMCVCVCVTAEAELSFDVEPADTVAYVGQPAVLDCVVNSRLHVADVYWIKDGATFQLDSRRLVTWSLASPFSTNIAISEINSFCNNV